MKTIDLSMGFVAKIDDEDYRLISGYTWSVDKRADGSIYARHGTTNHGKHVKTYMHRVIMGAKPGEYVDHINHDGLDNRRSNLRICSQSENLMNPSRNRTDNTTGCRGVTFDRDRSKYIAQINKDGRHVFIGRFNTVQEAAAAYKSKAVELFGSFVTPEA